MRSLWIAVALLAGITQPSWASNDNHTNKHLADINRLGKLIVQQDFEPVTAVAEGKDFTEAITRAAEILRDHIGLEKLFPVLCDCLDKVNLIPPEHCALLKKWNYSLTEMGAGHNRKVTLVFSLDSQQLRQLALFEMWPLYGQDFLKKTSS